MPEFQAGGTEFRIYAGILTLAWLLWPGLYPAKHAQSGSSGDRRVGSVDDGIWVVLLCYTD